MYLYMCHTWVLRSESQARYTRGCPSQVDLFRRRASPYPTELLRVLLEFAPGSRQATTSTFNTTAAVVVPVVRIVFSPEIAILKNSNRSRCRTAVH